MCACKRAEREGRRIPSLKLSLEESEEKGVNAGGETSGAVTTFTQKNCQLLSDEKRYIPPQSWFAEVEANGGRGERRKRWVEGEERGGGSQQPRTE